MSIANEHTPTPWKVNQHGLISSTQYWIGHVNLTTSYLCPPLHERLANAPLMAASPDLLTQLEISANLLCGFICRHRLGDPVKHADQCIANYAAIAKARGQNV